MTNEQKEMLLQIAIQSKVLLNSEHLGETLLFSDTPEVAKLVASIVEYEKAYTESGLEPDFLW